MLQPLLKSFLSKLKCFTVTTWWSCPTLLVALLKICWPLSRSGRISASFSLDVHCMRRCSCFYHFVRLITSSWTLPTRLPLSFHGPTLKHVGHSFGRSVPAQQPPWCRGHSISTLSSFLFCSFLLPCKRLHFLGQRRKGSGGDGFTGRCCQEVASSLTVISASAVLS